MRESHLVAELVSSFILSECPHILLAGIFRRHRSPIDNHRHHGCVCVCVANLCYADRLVGGG